MIAHKRTENEFLMMSAKDLSRITGMNEKNWHGWLTGKNSPTLTKMEQVAEQLNMDLAEFINALVLRRNLTVKRKRRNES